MVQAGTLCVERVGTGRVKADILCLVKEDTVCVEKADRCVERSSTLLDTEQKFRYLQPQKHW